MGRGIDRDTAVTFRVGVVDNPAPGHERFRGFLAIPYLSAAGYPLSLRFRCLAEHDHREFGHGKYMGLLGDGGRLFHVPALHAAEDEVHIAEGEFDAMVLNRVGLPAIALPGATSWAPHFRRVFAGFSRVFVWGDPDEAGAEMVSKVTRSLRQAVGVPLRDGDVSDVFVGSGFDPEAVRSLVPRQGAS